ncbi:hypothetical protein ASU31_10495 [Pedobacter ginsenosidimutans]|uniref:Secretin/TonB short N-terminal domain-containing protein n=2 Tax=Pedobacter ginsenosidimutans TaxID=687842 RepID=A0A0T5VQ10_9SPHI|nr:hypothetical protein ASU31_10495 [Pedobacter ginsenosidimutans]
MKLTILIITVFLLQVSASTNAQITLKETNAPLQKLLKSISIQSGYDFVYSSLDFKNLKPVTIELDNVTIENALKVAFEGQPLVYEVKDKTVMVKRKEKNESSIVDRITQYFTAIGVRGVILDEKLSPLSGANVRVKNGKGTTLTDFRGEFYLKNVAEGAILEVTFIGYKKVEIIAKEYIAPVRMELSDNKLDEVQVMFSGTTSRRTSTSNITTVKAEEIAKQPIDNPLFALQGRVPGLIITPTSGIPGAPVKLQIRGQNSLSGEYTQPLIVIDGIPFSNNIPGGTSFGTANLSALRFINPSDIASIDVLKDADATAIYGSRGANGVILITTKKGNVGATKVDVNMFTGISQRSNKKLPLLNTQQYLQMRKEAFKNDGLTLPTAPEPGNYDLTVWDQNRYTDWQNELGGGNGQFTSVQVSLSGGTQTLQYTLGGTYNGQTSMFLGSAKDQSGSGHFSLTGVSPNEKFRASLTANYTSNSSSSTDLTSAGIFLPPNAPMIYKPNGELNWEPNPLSGFATWTNPYASLSNIISSNTNTITTSADISYRFSPSIQFKSTLGFSLLQLKSYQPQSLASMDPATLSFMTAQATRNNNSSSSWSVEPQLSYNNHIGKGRLDAILGMSLQYNESELQYLNANGYTSDLSLKDLSLARNYYSANNNNEYKYAGLFSRLTYNWTDKYILNLNFRRDGSSRFGPGYQFGNFGSVGAAWVFTNELEMQKLFPWISFGKLRFSYGVTGNDNIKDYGYVELWGAISPPFGRYQDIATIQSSGAANPDYHWESTRKAELALDLGFFKDRLLLTASFFRNRSGDQLGSFSLPATAGGGSLGGIILNQDAKIQNSGAEFTLVAKVATTKDFGWSILGNISLATKNKLLSLADGYQGYPFIYGYDQNGKEISPIGKPFSGIIPVAEFRGVDPSTGLYLFADDHGNTNTDGFANRYARQITTRPDFTGGVSNQFIYKGFTLDIFTQFTKQMGRNYLFSTSFLSPGLLLDNGIGNIPLSIFDQRWVQQGDNAVFAKFTSGFGNVSNWIMASQSDAAWVDASFLRIKNVSLSYALPAPPLKKLHIQTLRFYLQGQNLLTFTKYKGADPETQDPLTLAPPRVVTAGISIGL